MTEQLKTNELLTMTANVVAAYVSNNTVTEGDLSKVIRGVYDTLASVGSPGETVKERPAPAVSIKKSVTLTPDQYRERWGLPADYPMVAPNYAKQRSRLARKIGLGTKARRGR
jgi:predicted transcriptional regulator